MRRRSFLGGVAATAAASATGLGLASPGAAAPVRHGAQHAQAAWQLTPAPAATPGSRLLSVSAAEADLAWAVGEQGVLADGTSGPLALRWDGSAWAHTDVAHLKLNGVLRSVSGSSATTAWAVGEDRDGADRLLRWDGSTWRQTQYPGSDDPATVLRWVTAGSDGTAWASGQHEGAPKLLRHDGRAWTWTPPIPDATTQNAPWRVRLSPSGSVYTMGEDLCRWDGTEWTKLPPITGIRLSITDLLPAADDDIWAVGGAFGIGGPPGKPPSVVLGHFDGTEWTYVDGDELPFTVGALTCITGDGEGRPCIVGGWDFWDDSSAHYYHWDGTSWTGQRGDADGTDAYVREVTHIPGTANGTWSVGHTYNATNPETRFRIERYA